MIDLSKVNRLEIIDHTHEVEDGGGRCYTYWSEYDNGIENPEISLDLQDEGRTLKVFIKPKEEK